MNGAVPLLPQIPSEHGQGQLHFHILPDSLPFHKSLILAKMFGIIQYCIYFVKY